MAERRHRAGPLRGGVEDSAAGERQTPGSTRPTIGVSDTFVSGGLKPGNGAADQLKSFFDREKCTPGDRLLAEKLKKDNATLAAAIKRLRAEAEEVARREGEAAEQVTSSVQVAEALRMEKAELEYEVGQNQSGIRP